MANIDLITGFLGAGKTTFIRKYAEFLHSKGERFAVIENEYGSKGIDSVILLSEGITTNELYGGCICCTLKVGFHDMLLRLSKEFDRVIVEPSGVYDISQFYTVMSSPELVGKCSIGNVICVVDPDSIDSLDDFSHEMLKKQIMASGCVVFSMHDNASSSEISEYTKKTESSLDLNEIKVLHYNDFQSLYRVGASDIRFESELSHTAKYLSTQIKASACDREEMKIRLEKIFSSVECGEVLRIKGVWGSFLVNAVRDSYEIYPCDSQDGLNIIGLDLNRRKIKEILNGEK